MCASKFLQEVPIELSHRLNSLVSAGFIFFWDPFLSLAASQSNGDTTANQNTADGFSRQNGPQISRSSPRVPFFGQVPNGLQALQARFSSSVKMHPLVCLGQNTLEKVLILDHAAPFLPNVMIF